MEDDEFSRDEWFEGMASAAFTLSIATIEMLYAKGAFDRAQLAEIMDAALASAESQPTKRPENVRPSMAARLHLDRAWVAIDQKADEIDARRAAGK